MFLGLNSPHINIIMNSVDSENSIRKFEEIRHHELSWCFPKIYRQNKYLGGV